MGDTLIDLTGKRFGQWFVLKRVENRNRAIMWKCKCDCGTVKIVHGTSLKSGTSTNCGCIRKTGLHRTHSKSNHPLYKVWQRIKGCTSSKTHQDYKHYGARGIKVCDEWLSDFQKFYEWSIQNGYKRGLEIDRINNGGNYEPSNCRWVNRSIQMRNTRRNILIMYRNHIKTLSEWSDITGISYNTLHNRIYRYGWSIEKAFTTPVGGANS